MRDPNEDAQGPPGSILGKSADAVIVDDPVRDEPAPVKVSRELGSCGFCGAADLQVIRAFDPRVFEGWACPSCVLSGKTSERYPPEGDVMRPMVFVARALRGDQPFADLLKAADLQRENPELAAKMKAKLAKRMAPVAVINRKARRTADAVGRKKKKKKKAAKPAKKGDR